MDNITRERARTFIDQAIQKTNNASQETSTAIQNLGEIYSQFSEVIVDLLEAKNKYISVVEKYLDNSPTTTLGNYFPGLNHKNTNFMSQSEMEVDTNEMDQMAELVKDLETQKEALEDQLERTFKKTVGNIHQIEALSEQASNYLDDMISDVGEIYGSASMQQLVQKSSL